MSDLSYTVNSFDDLSKTFASVREYTARVAKEQLEKFQQEHADAVVFVDGSKTTPINGVKLFGTVIITARSGPVQEAVGLAWDFVFSRALSFQNPTGFYANQFVWFINGDPVGSAQPNVSRMGARGNVQLVNRAGYASMPEIFLADGVIWGAYNMLRRTFGERLALSFGYGPAHAFAQVWPGDRTRVRPLAVPVLTIGHPSAGFKRRGTKPGVLNRKRAREARKAREGGT